MKHHELLDQSKLIHEFFFDLNIRWELIGYDKWTELVSINGDMFIDEIAMPLFRYFLHWADKSLLFTIGYQPVENQIYIGTRELQALNVCGDEPAWNWRRYLHIENMYMEAEEQCYLGKEHGVIIPTWIDLLQCLYGLNAKDDAVCGIGL